MNDRWFSFQFLGLPTTVLRSVMLGSAIVFALGVACAVIFTDLTPLDSVMAGLCVVALHWFGELMHQYGHSIAARRVGYPMIGIRLWWVLGTSLYPPNEKSVTPKAHIQRALGGPAISFAILLVGMLLIALLTPGGMLRFLLWWLVGEHLIIFAGGALFPPITLGWFSNDGGTILHWYRKGR